MDSQSTYRQISAALYGGYVGWHKKEQRTSGAAEPARSGPALLGHADRIGYEEKDAAQASLGELPVRDNGEDLQGLEMALPVPIWCQHVIVEQQTLLRLSHHYPRPIGEPIALRATHEEKAARPLRKPRPGALAGM